MLRLTTALIGALAPPLAIAWLWFGTWSPMPDVIVTATLHVVFLGLPALVLHFVIAPLRWWTLIGLGALCATLPTAVWSWPLMVPPAPTVEEWAGYGEAVGVMAGYGAIAGLGFWLVWAFWNRIDALLEARVQ